MKYCMLILTLVLSLSSFAADDKKETLKIYGSEGPTPPVREAADAFAAANNIQMEVISTPLDKWRPQARKDADIIYSGSENVMDTYNDDLGILDDKTITTLFMRPAALLVRKGNPKKIKGIRDLLQKDVKVITVNGQGQVALWEDIVGRLKDVQALSDFRKRIVFTARNSSEATVYWKNHEEVDVWIAFNTWAKREDVITADVVNIEKDLIVYRSMGAAVTTITNQRELSLKFIEFLKTPEAEKIFKAQGWFKKEK
ncbi:substrate-binding domain-containing protein [Bdellovibrio sp. HCB337]|uniref:substrate-binding domain-containing protein n=1 Tax=Bdellovibrio sp. HCB337 TaxID=3394358 RepID=UPI0039A60401